MLARVSEVVIEEISTPVEEPVLVEKGTAPPIGPLILRKRTVCDL